MLFSKYSSPSLSFSHFFNKFSSYHSALTFKLITPMVSLHKRITRLFASYKPRIESLRRRRKSPHRDVEEEDATQYEGGTLCLTSSSYYSVFAVRLAIMIMLAILIGLLTILTWHITRVYTKRSLNALAFGLRHELLQRPVLRMWSIINSTVEVATAQVKLSESVIKRYNRPNPTNQAQQIELYEVMRDVTWATFASRKALNSLTLKYRNGFVQAFHRNQRNNNTYYIYSDLVNYSISNSYDVSAPSSHQGWNDQSIRSNISAVWYREPLDPNTGEKIGKSTQIPPDELINIAGISQVPDGAPSWHVAVSKYTDSPLLSAALPVWDPANGSIVAVVGVTTALYSVGQLMRELVEFHSGHIYLTSQEGWLLATSTNTPLLTKTSAGPKLLMAVDSQDGVIRAGAECLRRASGNKQEVHLENAKLGGRVYYIDSFFLNLKRLPMVGVIIIPRQYVMGKVDEKAFKLLKILISASVCILVVGCLCIFILTNGVSKEMNLRAALISHLDARRKAEASSNYKSQFLANMSHELRTPMAAVIGLLDILTSDNSLTNEQHVMIAQIRKCSTALLRLLNNILDLSKVESGKLILEETEFDLGRELEGLIDMFSVQCIDHNIETVLDLSDDMPKLVLGDSGRVLQIFANLVSNSIKFTTSGYITVRGWFETFENNSRTRLSHNNPDESRREKTKHKWHQRMCSKKDDRVTLWFEVDDSGCGIDPSKWESVFESFEQADPSTTRLHGGTGLGLCIVRTLVNKMNGEIKVVKKNGPGTLMRLSLVLKTPPNITKQLYRFNFEERNLTVMLAVHGKMTRLLMAEWLQRKGVKAYEAENWNQLTLKLEEMIKPETQFQKSSPNEYSEAESDSVSIVVIDISFLDLNTDIWKQQLKFLDSYRGLAHFAWILTHDTSNIFKTELRRTGHLVMVNRPLYKGKIVQIIEDVLSHRNTQLEMNTAQSQNQAAFDGQLHEFLELDPLESGSVTTVDSDKSVNESFTDVRTLHAQRKTGEEHLTGHFNVQERDEKQCRSMNVSSHENQSTTASSTEKSVNEKKSLEGVCILLAEDTPVLQRVATIMLEKMGAKVDVVGDGFQAVDNLKRNMLTKEYRQDHLSSYDLILMDCQMPKMDGYEATKAIRRLEIGTGQHIPIVALTAHAMSCDEAKCLEVGMDAYLTKPIDCKLMVLTILSLTKGKIQQIKV